MPGTGRARERLARAADRVPLTARGAWLSLVCVAALELWGRAAQDLLVRVLATTGLVAVALGIVLVGLGALRLRAALSRGIPGTRRVSIEVGCPAPSGFSLPVARGWLLRADLGWLAPAEVECELRARSGRTEEWVLARRRFEVSAVRRRIAVEDGFGLARLAWVHPQPQLVTALPMSGARIEAVLPAVPAHGEEQPAARALPEGDRLDLRRYQPGDPARQIVWRSWARSRELFVRTPEPSAAPARRVHVHLVCGSGDEPAAGAARALLESGALDPGWYLTADGCSGEARGLEAALSLLARSGNARDSLQALDSSGWIEAAPGEALLIFAPAPGGPWVEHVERAARMHAGSCAIVLVPAGPASSRAARRRGRRTELPVEQEVEALRARLDALGSVVVTQAAGSASGGAAARVRSGHAA